MSAPVPHLTVRAGSGEAPSLLVVFASTEIGPVGQSVFLHGFTASVGLFVAK